jgi:uncharacterized protein (TIGR02646 family)
MLKVNKGEAPDFFKEYKREQILTNWENVDPQIKGRLKEHMISQEQSGYCPYCEVEISKNKSEIEHIHPKDKFKDIFLEYGNLIAICTHKKTCGGSKGNQWDDLFIDPASEDPADYLTYDIMRGKVIPRADIKVFQHEKANRTISLLNLNDKRLCEARKVVITQFWKYLKRDENKEYIDTILKFPSLMMFLKEGIQ